MKPMGLAAIFLSLILSPIVRADRIDDLEKQIALLLAQQKQMQQDMADLKAQMTRLAAAAPTTAAAPMAAAGATSPAPTANGQRWVVTVLSNTPPNLDAIKSQLADEQQNLTAAQKRADELHKHADNVANAKDPYRTDPITHRPLAQYDSRTITEARSAAMAADAEVQKSKNTIVRLQRQISDAQASRSVMGTLDNGQPVEVIGAGELYRPMAEKMVVGMKYSVEGMRTMVDGKSTIKLRVVVPLQATP